MPTQLDLFMDELKELRKEMKEFREVFHAFQLQVVTDQAEKRGAVEEKQGTSRTVTAVISAAVSAAITLLAAYLRK
jgi:hypothetical protein